MLKDIHEIDPPPHPGEILREDLMPTYDLSQRQLADALGISRGAVRSFLSESRPVSIDLAQRLGLVFGQGPQYWLGLQMQHDLWIARSRPLPKIKPLVRPQRRQGPIRQKPHPLSATSMHDARGPENASI
ncbi:MAG: HigA family addiction module antitoxin [Pseudomonadota bacterium]